MCGIFTWAFLCYGSREKNAAAVVFKGLASSCFVIAGLLLSSGTNTAKHLAAGLITGCIADVAIELRKVFTDKAQVPFLVGSFLFLAGHIMYLAAVFPMSSHKLICIGAAVILIPAVMRWILSRITAKNILKITGFVYIGTIIFLNCAAVINLMETPSAFTGIFAAGAFLFMMSDILLVLNTFGTEYSQRIKNIYISLYYAGQILIAMSLQYLS